MKPQALGLIEWLYFLSSIFKLFCSHFDFEFCIIDILKLSKMWTPSDFNIQCMYNGCYHSLSLALQLFVHRNFSPRKDFLLFPLPYFFNWKITLSRFLSWSCCCFWKLYTKQTQVRTINLPFTLKIISPLLLNF